MAFAFAQHAWLPDERMELNVSARLDAHTDYAARLTPKASLLVRPLDGLRLRASVGSGFKAPDFRQLYLSFTNAAAGYSVFGAAEVRDGLERLEREGRLVEALVPADAAATLGAEHSLAYNAGFTAEPLAGLALEANAFYNDVYDLIDTQPIARKTNGSFVYSYFNLSRIYTRGLDLQVRVVPFERLAFTTSYQFLQAPCSAACPAAPTTASRWPTTAASSAARTTRPRSGPPSAHPPAG